LRGAGDRVPPTRRGRRARPAALLAAARAARAEHEGGTRGDDDWQKAHPSPHTPSRSDWIAGVILENGTVRTLDPALPKAGALAIAGDVVAGGVGTHETALASPERVDLGGRCVLPGFTDSHVHFPTWALAQRQVRLEGARTLDEALARVREAAASVPEGRWLRGLGWRSGDWSPAVEPTKEDLDAVTGDVPTALMARDYHSLWLNSAALTRTNG